MEEVKVLEINKKKGQGFLRVLEATVLTELSSFRCCSEMKIVKAQ
jgi:hypothetical protein